MSLPAAILAMLLLIPVLVSCSDERPAVEENLATLEADLRLVAIDSSIDLRWRKGAKILIVSPTTTEGTLEFENDQERKELIEGFTGELADMTFVREDTVESLIAENQNPIKLTEEHFPAVDYVQIIDHEEYTAFFHRAAPDSGWAALRTKYPDTIAVVRVSAFGWSPDHDEALIWVSTKAPKPEPVGGGEYYVLRRRGSQYSVMNVPNAPAIIR